MLLPNYQIGEAAKYAHISAQTVAAWHKDSEDQRTLSFKDSRAALSYMQLIEVAVVAAFRRAGVALKDIRKARAYAKQELRAEFPFSEYHFKTDGKNLLIGYEQLEGKKGRGKLLTANKHGQLAWGEIVKTLEAFDYDKNVAIRWRVDGDGSPVIIDPRISFGAPTVSGTPTWVIRGRWEAGESIEDIAEDFGLKKPEVKKALAFEGAGAKREKEWAN
jgi:uncharacterized protein (DUF433 family)